MLSDFIDRVESATATWTHVVMPCVREVPTMRLRRPRVLDAEVERLRALLRRVVEINDSDSPEGTLMSLESLAEEIRGEVTGTMEDRP